MQIAFEAYILFNIVIVKNINVYNYKMYNNEGKFRHKSGPSMITKICYSDQDRVLMSF